MKRKQEKPAYDRIAAGERLRCRRLELWLEQRAGGRAARCRQQIFMRISSGEPGGMSVETLINLSRLYGVSLDTLIYGEKEKQSPVSQGEQLMRGLDRMPQVVQDYCLRMLWLFADGLRAAQEETAEYETVKSSSDSEENSGSED